VRQLPHISKAYARFKDQGFEVLSYSMDSKREDLLAAVKKHNMMWLQAIDPDLKAFEGETAKRLFVWGLPTAYLVSADGTILARDWEMEGEKLEQHVEKFFGGPSPPTAER